MPNRLIKINEDGNKEDVDDNRWHATITRCGEESLLCTGDFIGIGSGAEDYEAKTVKRGGCTCEDCLALIREIKDFKL